MNLTNNLVAFALGTKRFNVKKELFSRFTSIKAKEIIKKTGPEILYRANSKEDSLTLAIKAFKYLKLNKKKIGSIKNLIFVTETPIKLFPGNGYIFASKNVFQDKLNIIDINAGCTGFVDALKIANCFEGNTLIVCSETYSKHIKKFDRSVSTLFSDAASVFFYDKKIFNIIKYTSGFEKNTFNDLFCDHDSVLKMKGADVFNFCTSTVFPSLENFIDANKVKVSKIYIHQASSMVINFVRSKFFDNKILVPSNIMKIGNTVSSSIPILIYDDLKNNNIKKGSYLILCSFGVGLAFNIMLIKYNGQ